MATFTFEYRPIKGGKRGETQRATTDARNKQQASANALEYVALISKSTGIEYGLVRVY